jgi:LysM repeat protein
MFTHQSSSLRLLILLTGACIAFLLISGRVDASTPDAEPVTYRVVAGDTLWDIASRRTGPTEDIRVVVAEIKHLNRLTTSSIQVGQQLLIP